MLTPYGPALFIPDGTGVYKMTMAWSQRLAGFRPDRERKWLQELQGLAGFVNIKKNERSFLY